jgi:predicted phage tail protein
MIRKVQPTNSGSVITVSPKLSLLILTFVLLLFYSGLLFSATIYIDPTNTASGQNGTISNPYSSWSSVAFVNGNTYLQKRGTTYYSYNRLYINSRSNVTIGAYGSGDRPKFSYTGYDYAIRLNASSGCTIENFEINGNAGAMALVGIMGSSGAYSANNKVDNCHLYNAHNSGNGGFGVYSIYNTNLQVLNTEIHNVALDGMYLRYTPNVTIGYCNIYDVNRRYFTNSNEAYSSGDGIQFDGDYNGFHVHHTTIDRTNGAGNKYNLICNSASGVSEDATGIIEYCEFINGSNVVSAVLIERGNGIITRYNTFRGSTQGLRLGGAYTTNNLIHNNIFRDCESGVGIGYTYPSTGPATNTKVYNNVFYHVSDYHIWVDKSHVETRNNIHVRTSDAGVALFNYGNGSWTISNNCYSTSATAGAPGTGSSPVIGNPSFIDPGSGNFNIQGNSPCINKGTNVGVPFDMIGTSIFQGTAPEIGAYEFLTTGSNLPPSVGNQTFSVNENSANGSSVGTVQASDPNSGQTLTFSIVSGNSGSAFAINQGSGLITVANSSALNFELAPAFSLVVRVTDNGSPVLYSQATITINLLNVNEAPAISNQSFSVAQTAGNGTAIGTVQAGDPDAGQLLAYSIVAGNTGSCFAINASTGVLTVSNSSAMAVQAYYLTIRATDNGSPVLFSDATVTVNVTSTTNLPPVIANQSFSVVQNSPPGYGVGQVIASDPNAGQTLTFSITGGNTNNCFGINAGNGVIYVYNSTMLTPQVFNLTVRATDNGSPVLYSQATVTITVTSPNLAPVIANQSFSVVQNVPNGTSVGQVVATDPNSGQTISFSITAGNTNTCFSINSGSGLISVNNSTALTPQTFNLTVRATDNGSPVLYSQATVTIVVTATTNQPPVIANQSFSVVQNTPNGASVGQVIATDPNSGQTLTFSITGGNTNTCFGINAGNGVVYISNSSALTPQTFNLTVRATDNGSPVLYSQATVTIAVTATTNQPPVIANQSFSVVQNTPNGTGVGQVIATDPNTGQTLTFSITGGNTNTCFGINSGNGVIYVLNSPLLTPQTFNLTVRATDNGSPVLYSQASVTITVTSSNLPPVIANQSFSVVQNTPNGTSVGQVVATDPNAGQTLTYSITGGNTNTCFGINSSNGVIYVLNSPLLTPQTFSLTVRATDNGNPVMYSQATVTIVVTATTNQPPVIANQSFSVVQNSPNGYGVGQVVATDPNAGQTLTFSITGGNTNTCFGINSGNGVIYVSNSTALTPQTFNLTVRATDNGSPVLYSQATVTITVTPTNYPPVMANQSFSVVQNSPNGYGVGQVVATDPNTGQTLTFSITGGNTNSCFGINSGNGVIYVLNSPLLTPQTFNLTVRATDNGNPVMYAQATVTITVTPSNLPPVIAGQSFSVVQNMPNGYGVGQVVATDPNAGQTLTFSITGGNTNTCFGINTGNGVIYVSNSTALTPQTFNLTVRATDNGTPVLYSQATVTITVTYLNLAPIVNNQSFDVTPYAMAGTHIGTIIASDQNPGQNLTYSITSGNQDESFKINQYDGTLTVQNEQELHPGSRYLKIRVSDNGTPGLWTDADVEVKIHNAANTSLIVQNEFELSGDLYSGKIVGNILQASPAGQERTEITFPDHHQSSGFAISNTGEITVNRPEMITAGSRCIRTLITQPGSGLILADTMVTIRMTGSGYTAQAEGYPGLTSNDDVLLLKVYPNPSPTGIFKLRFSNTPAKTDISVVDLSGKLIRTLQSFNEDEVTIDLSEMGRGTYLILVKSGSQSETIRAIIG